MAFVYFNPNPSNQRVGDCVVRALVKALNRTWESVYIEIACEGLKYYDMPSSNYVWGMYLQRHGFEQRMIPSLCPSCTTVSDFAKEHAEGTYVLACQSHVVTVVNGRFYDTWDSGGEIVLYYWQKKVEE